MARQFASASSQYFINTAAIKAGAPLSMACWFYPDTVAAAMTMLSIGTTAAQQSQFRLTVRGDQGGDPVGAECGNSGGTFTGSYASGGVAGSWQHAAGVWASTSSRTAYRNGSAATTDTVGMTPSGLDRTTIGARAANAGIGLFWNGRIAEAAIWNEALSPHDINALAAGYCPLLIRPTALIGYWPLHSRGVDEEDWGSSAFLMTNTNSVTSGEHPPRIIYPSRRRLILPSGVVPPAATYPFRAYRSLLGVGL
jgi:hypothetical protein